MLKGLWKVLDDWKARRKTERDAETRALIEAAIVSEDVAIDIYRKLAERERRGERISDAELWKQLQLISPRVGRYETYCRQIDELTSFGDKLLAPMLINQHRRGVSPFASKKEKPMSATAT